MRRHGDRTSAVKHVAVDFHPWNHAPGLARKTLMKSVRFEIKGFNKNTTHNFSHQIKFQHYILNRTQLTSHMVDKCLCVFLVYVMKSKIVQLLLCSWPRSKSNATRNVTSHSRTTQERANTTHFPKCYAAIY